MTSEVHAGEYATCADCGSRVFNLGCVNCNEPAYIAEQEYITERDYVRMPDGTSAHRDDVRKNAAGEWVWR